MNDQDRFMVAYENALSEDMAKHPERYGRTSLHIVVERMRVAFEQGSYNQSSPAVRGACKAVGIKPTRTAINAFWGNGQ